MEKSCIICNAMFIATRSDKETCSDRCRQKLWRKRAAKSENEIYEEGLMQYLNQNHEFRERIRQQIHDLFNFGVSITEETVDGSNRIDPLSEKGTLVLEKVINEENNAIHTRVEEIEAEIASHQEEIEKLGKGTFATQREGFLNQKISILKKELYNLKNQLK